jgi:hypothetical protein
MAIVGACLFWEKDLFLGACLILEDKVYFWSTCLRMKERNM